MEAGREAEGGGGTRWGKMTAQPVDEVGDLREREHFGAGQTEDNDVTIRRAGCVGR